MTARLLTLLLAVSALGASAQTAPLAALDPVPASAPAPSAELSAYAGHYSSDGGGIDIRVDVRAEGSRLVALAYGAPVAARLARLAPDHSAVDARAETLLDAWVAGDLAPLAAASGDAEADARLGTLRSALVRGYGEPVAANVVGTFRQTDGRAATLTQVLFERGVDWVSFVWDGDDLATVMRGLGPVVLSDLRAVGSDTFEGVGADPGAALVFGRRSDGRVAGLSVGGRPIAVR